MNWIEVVSNNLALKESVIQGLLEQKQSEMEKLTNPNISVDYIRHVQGRIEMLSDFINELSVKDQENDRPDYRQSQPHN